MRTPSRKAVERDRENDQPQADDAGPAVASTDATPESDDGRIGWREAARLLGKDDDESGRSFVRRAAERLGWRVSKARGAAMYERAQVETLARAQSGDANPAASDADASEKRPANVFALFPVDDDELHDSFATDTTAGLAIVAEDYAALFSVTPARIRAAFSTWKPRPSRARLVTRVDAERQRKEAKTADRAEEREERAHRARMAEFDKQEAEQRKRTEAEWLDLQEQRRKEVEARRLATAEAKRRRQEARNGTARTRELGLSVADKALGLLCNIAGIEGDDASK